ncbi:hypothetical protein F4777DRAFT_587126 [Nemania sp. FL0916]|nr:hypothetical protein F4777DRAFT_587126 [Nemania sp. FL0916]
MSLNKRPQNARREFAKIRNAIPPHEVCEEFALMRAQIEYEKDRARLGYRENFRVYQHRVWVCFVVQILTTLTGVNYYQHLAIDAKTILAFAATWETRALVPMMFIAGVTCVIITEIYSAILQPEFQRKNYGVGKYFAIPGIYIFAPWCSVTEAGPTAFANIGKNYYYVFITICAIHLVLIYLYFPETKQNSLKEMAAAFGDRVIEVSEQDIGIEGKAFNMKVAMRH